jgi:hypothetical protein
MREMRAFSRQVNAAIVDPAFIVKVRKKFAQAAGCPAYTASRRVFSRSSRSDKNTLSSDWLGNVALVGQYLQIFDHGHRQPHGDGAQCGLEFDELHPPASRPIDVFGRVRRGPELKLFVLVLELRNLLHAVRPYFIDTASSA